MTDSPARSFVRRALLHGVAASLSDAELLSQLICRTKADRDTRDLADRLLRTTGGLRPLLASKAALLGEIPGIGPANIARLVAAVELGRRYIETPARRMQQLQSPRDAAHCFKARLADLPYEVFACVYLDSRHRVIEFEPLFRGTIDGASVYAREVLRRALYHNAAAVIVGHNHPSGSCEPSEADRRITARLRQSLALLDIPLLDHLIVAPTEHLSLAERGWL